MRSAWETVHRFSRNDRQLQGTPGAIAVLHTHSRRLDFHPHVHLVASAAAIEAAGLPLPARYPQEWVAHCTSVGGGDKALIYLGRYLYRGVIREEDILACADGQVTFRYRNAESGKLEKRILAGADFLWLIFQHVLPKGFRRARNFGFLHANCKRLIGLLHLLLRFDPNRFTPPRKERPSMLCSCCGAVMKIIKTRIRPASSGVVAVPPVVAVAI